MQGVLHFLWFFFARFLFCSGVPFFLATGFCFFFRFFFKRFCVCFCQWRCVFFRNVFFLCVVFEGVNGLCYIAWVSPFPESTSSLLFAQHMYSLDEHLLHSSVCYTRHNFKSQFLLCLTRPAPTLAVHSHLTVYSATIHTNVFMVAEQRIGGICWTTCCWQPRTMSCRSLANLRSLAERRTSGTELRHEKLRVSTIGTSSSAIGRRRRFDEPRHEHDENQDHPHGWRRCSSPETLPRLGDERERTSVGSDQRNHRDEWSISMACVDHEIRTRIQRREYKVSWAQSSMWSPFPQSSRPMRSPWTSGRKTFASGNRFREIVSTCQWRRLSSLTKHPQQCESLSRCRVWTPSSRWQCLQQLLHRQRSQRSQRLMDLITSTAALPMTYRQPWNDARYGQRPSSNGMKYGQIRQKSQKQKLAQCWTTSIWTSIKVRLHLRNRSTWIARMKSSQWTLQPLQRPSITISGRASDQNREESVNGLCYIAWVSPFQRAHLLCCLHSMCTVLMNTFCIAVCDILDIISSLSSFLVSHAPRLHLQFTHTSRCAVPRSTPMSSDGVFSSNVFFFARSFNFFFAFVLRWTLFFFCKGFCVSSCYWFCVFFTLVFVLLCSQVFFFARGCFFCKGVFLCFQSFFLLFFSRKIKIFSKSFFFLVRFFFFRWIVFFTIFFPSFFANEGFFSGISRRNIITEQKKRRRIPNKILNEGFSVGFFLIKKLFLLQKNVGFLFRFFFFEREVVVSFMSFFLIKKVFLLRGRFS